MSVARADLLTSGMARAAVASLVAAAAALAYRLAEPLDHGVWLVAYLFLVGFLAQLLLGWGLVVLLRRAPAADSPSGLGAAPAVLWNVGVVAVPFGVLAGTRLAVVIGALSLLGALIVVWRGVHPALARTGAGQRWLARAYVALMVFMAGSVIVGTALAWDEPWV